MNFLFNHFPAQPPIDLLRWCAFRGLAFSYGLTVVAGTPYYTAPQTSRYSTLVVATDKHFCTAEIQKFCAFSLSEKRDLLPVAFSAIFLKRYSLPFPGLRQIFEARRFLPLRSAPRFHRRWRRRSLRVPGLAWRACRNCPRACLSSPLAQ